MYSRIFVAGALAAGVALAGCAENAGVGEHLEVTAAAAPVVLRGDGAPAAAPGVPIGHQDAATRTVRWPMGAERVHEEHLLFDCRIDGNQQCGPHATVPVPSGHWTSTAGESWRYVPIDRAPWPPLWRQYAPR